MANMPVSDHHLRRPLYEIERASSPTTVCMTGANGYVGSAITERLLAMGHTVHAAVIDAEDEKAVAHLKELPGAERLKFFTVSTCSGCSQGTGVDCVICLSLELRVPAAVQLSASRGGEILNVMPRVGNNTSSRSSSATYPHGLVDSALPAAMKFMSFSIFRVSGDRLACSRLQAVGLLLTEWISEVLGTKTIRSE